MKINRYGFACMSKVINTKYRTLRVNKFNTGAWYGCIYHNLVQTLSLINYANTIGAKILRLSSDIIPLATHKVTSGIELTESIKKILIKIGQKVQELDIKVSFHPSQYLNLNSPTPRVVEKSIETLKYHYKMFNLMGISGDIVIHIGGVYGDKEEAIKRFVSVFNGLEKDLRKSIIIENDDKSYNINDVVRISKETNTRIVFDLHHHICNHTELKVNYKDIFYNWGEKVPKIHISSPYSNSNQRKHHDYINLNDVRLLKLLIDIPDKVNIMVEAKYKDKAVLKFIKDWKKILGD